MKYIKYFENRDLPIKSDSYRLAFFDSMPGILTFKCDTVDGVKQCLQDNNII